MKNEEHGREIYNLAKKIFPICRSITGDGVRETLSILSDYIASDDGIGFDIKEVPTGTKAFDWEVPKEWRIREAFIEDEKGNRIIDFGENNLHVLGYSTPVDRWVELEELKRYIYVQEDQPEYIPYVTSYYKERYGFCMSKNQLDSLSNGKYHMYIDSELFDGSLTYAEIVLKGKTEEEVFFSTYACHPSMANNECSGPALISELIKYVKSLEERRYTYRFVIAPETIGPITYLSENSKLEHLKKHVIAGFNLSCVGDEQDFSVIESKYANTLADKALKNVLKTYTRDHFSEYSFLMRESDERQYNSAGVDLPVVGFCRTKYREFPEYHTSADDMDFVTAKGFQGSYDVMTRVIECLENNYVYIMMKPCEPQLGKYGLYPTLSKKDTAYDVMSILNLVAYADGKNDLVDISNRINVSVQNLVEIVKRFEENKLIKRVY